MDPASIVGLAAGTVTLLKLLSQGVLSVKTMLHGIRDVYENTRGLGEELDTFQFSLTVLDFEIRNGSAIREIQGWWGITELDAFLANARKTFLRLETIFRDIHRHRSILRRPREYFRTNLYEQEICHLRLRINTYTSAFNIPIVLLAIHSTRGSSRQVDQSPNLNLLGDRISQLEEGITNICNDIRAFNTRRVTNESTRSPQAELPVQRESEELVEIARTLVSNASSVVTSEGTQSTPSTMKAFGPASSIGDTGATQRRGDPGVAGHMNTDESGYDASYSVTGIPLTAQRRERIESWIPQSQTTRSPDLPPDDLYSIPDVASITITETSRFSDALPTPPSTINSQDDTNIEAELIKKRYKRAKDLMGRQKCREAIPHLKRTLDAIRTTGENPVFQDTRVYQKVQLLLATALIDTDSKSAEAGDILWELFESPKSEQLERFSAAHLLAQLYLNQLPNSYADPKAMCLTAVKGRNAALGRTHPETYASIALLCRICQALKDSDEEIWRDMLPEEYRSHSTDTWKESSLRRKLKGHSNYVYTVAFSPDGQMIASGSADGTIMLWNTATGAACSTLKGHLSYVKSVAFSPDGQMVASGSSDYTIMLWNTATGAACSTLNGHLSSVTSVAFSPDGQMVASGSCDKTVMLWNTSTGAVHSALSGHSSLIESVAFSPDGQMVASGSGDNTVMLWNTSRGVVRSTLRGHSNYVTSVAFSPDGQMIASGSGDGTIMLWNTSTGALHSTLKGYTDCVYAVTFSPDGQLVASGSHYTVELRATW